MRGAYELEVLAVINAVKKCRIYLLGINFKIVTDCVAFAMTIKRDEIVYLKRITGTS